VERGPAPSPPASLKKIRDNQEKDTLLQVLEHSKYNKNKASLVLGIHRTALYKKMKKHQIPLHPF
jgi:transcriptional regulator with PAS, ATPase and Fis domain